VVDLVDVTFVDERGENVLKKMMIEGTQFVVRSVYIRSLLESLSQQRKQEA
jgi:hypothetical protein